MRNVKKIGLAAAVMTLALSGGLLVSNVANAADSTVLTELTIANGMAIRMNNPEGLRFQATLSMSDEEMQNAKIVGTGMILMPADKVVGELEYGETHTDGTVALNIPTAVYNSESTADSKSYYSVLVDTDLDGAFPAEFYNVPISARAYVEYEDGKYKYSEETVTRSIGYVAAMHYLSGNANDTQGIVAKIVNGATKEIVLESNDLLAGGENVNTAIIVGGIEVESENVEGLSVVWSVEGDAVQVDAQTGVVTPVKGGTATVKATASINGGQPITLTKEVTVDVTTKEASVESFVMKQSNNAGTLVTNDYTYELSDVNVKAVTLGGKALTLDKDYTVVNNTLTVKGTAFEGLERGANLGKEQLLKVESDTENVEVTFGKIITFAITKASDVNPGSNTVDPLFMTAGECSATGWSGYFVLANDVDFGFAKLAHNIYRCGNANNWGSANGFAGIFDGQGNTFKNFRLSGDNLSFFGQISKTGLVKNTRFENYRTKGTAQYKANFGLFDKCWGTVDGVYVDGTADDTSPILGNFQTGSKLTNSNVYVRVGAITESATTTSVLKGSADMTGTTINTGYKVDAANAKNATIKHWASDYYAFRVDDDTQAHAVTALDFVKEIKGTKLTAFYVYGSTEDADAVNYTSKATLADGKVTVPYSEFFVSGQGKLKNLGRGKTIKIVTDQETVCYTTDLVTYAIDEVDDLNGGSKSTLPRVAKAGGATTGYTTNANTSKYAGYFILANDFSCAGVNVQNGIICASNTNAYQGLQDGIIDGRGFTMSDITQGDGQQGWTSLFGNISQYGTLKNLRVVGWVKNGKHVAGLADKAMGNLDNLYLDFTITSNADFGTHGGIVKVCKSLTNSTVIVRGSNTTALMFGEFSTNAVVTGTVLYTDIASTASDFANYKAAGGVVKSLSELPTA